MNTIIEDMNGVKRLFDIPSYQLNMFPNPKMFVTKVNNDWIPMSTEAFVAKVNQLSLGLIALGIEVGERVALVSPNKVEWNIMDIAIQQVGAIVVPVYPNISSADYTYIFNDATIRYAFVGTEELCAKINGLKETIPTLKEVYSLINSSSFYHYETLIENGR